MIPDQVVIPVRTDVTTTWKDSESSFTFRPDRPLKWLQNICFFILKKIRAYSLTSMMTETVIRLEREQLMPHIYAILKEASKHQYDRIERIVMGVEDFQELIRQPMPHSATLHLPTALLGFPVQVVPWIKGIVVIPKLKNDPDPWIRDQLWKRPTPGQWGWGQ